MATLTLSVTTGGGTSSQTLTFSAADASRILTAYQASIKPGGTQADLVAFIATQINGQLTTMVVRTETVLPTPPVLT